VWVQIDDDNEPRTYVIDRIEEDEDAGEDQVVLAADGEEAQLPLSEVADLLNGQRAYQEKFVGVVGDGIATGSTQIPPRKKSKKEKPPELTVVICQTTAACPSGLQLGYKLAHVLKRFHQVSLRPMVKLFVDEDDDADHLVHAEVASDRLYFEKLRASLAACICCENHLVHVKAVGPEKPTKGTEAAKLQEVATASALVDAWCGRPARPPEPEPAPAPEPEPEPRSGRARVAALRPQPRTSNLRTRITAQRRDCY